MANTNGVKSAHKKKPSPKCFNRWPGGKRLALSKPHPKKNKTHTKKKKRTQTPSEKIG